MSRTLELAMGILAGIYLWRMVSSERRAETETEDEPAVMAEPNPEQTRLQRQHLNAPDISLFPRKPPYRTGP